MKVSNNSLFYVSFFLVINIVAIKACLLSPVKAEYVIPYQEILELNVILHAFHVETDISVIKNFRGRATVFGCLWRKRAPKIYGIFVIFALLTTRA